MPKLGESSKYRLYNEDCREVMRRLKPDSIDSMVTDPPYGLSFMGKGWDHGVPGEEFWELALRVVKPGSCLLAFGGTRTFHRLAVAIEDSGWEIRDCIMWVYGTGFPKGKSCLKPAWEPILLCRKPGKVKPLQIDVCRVPMRGEQLAVVQSNPNNRKGRFPANLIHDGSEEVVNSFPFSTDGIAVQRNGGGQKIGGGYGIYSGTDRDLVREDIGYGGSGSAARFFYTAKASSRERDYGLDGLPLHERPGVHDDDSYEWNEGQSPKVARPRRNNHPTVKPLALVRYLCRLVTPSNGLCFDPFMGSGTAGVAAGLEGFQFIGAENDTEHGYFEIARRRIKKAYTEAKLYLSGKD